MNKKLQKNTVKPSDIFRETETTAFKPSDKKILK